MHLPEADKEYSICTQHKRNLAINLSGYTHICRYHKYPKRTSYTNDTLTPKGMCIDLFHSAYPYCLSLLYGAAYAKKIRVCCPNPAAYVSIEVNRKPTKTRYLREFMIWLLAKFGYRIDFPSMNIIMAISEDASSGCFYSYKKGQTFKFNIWLGRELCPATFDALYPSVHNLMRGGKIPWSSLGNSDNKIICPDPGSNITMSINQENTSKIVEGILQK